MVYQLLLIFFCSFLNVMDCLGGVASDDEAPTGIKTIYLVSEEGEETAFAIPCGTQKGLKVFFEATRDCQGGHTMDLSSNSSLTTKGIEEIVSWLSDEAMWPRLEVLKVNSVLQTFGDMCLLLPLLKRSNLLIDASGNKLQSPYSEAIAEQVCDILEPTETEIEQCTDYGDTDAESKKKAIECFYLNRFVYS